MVHAFAVAATAGPPLPRMKRDLVRITFMHEPQTWNGPRPLVSTKGTGSFQTRAQAQGGPARYTEMKKEETIEAEATATNGTPGRRRNKRKKERTDREMRMAERRIGPIPAPRDPDNLDDGLHLPLKMFDHRIVLYA